MKHLLFSPLKYPCVLHCQSTCSSMVNKSSLGYFVLKAWLHMVYLCKWPMGIQVNYWHEKNSAEIWTSGFTSSVRHTESTLLKKYPNRRSSQAKNLLRGKFFIVDCVFALLMRNHNFFSAQRMTMHTWNCIHWPIGLLGKSVNAYCQFYFTASHLDQNPWGLHTTSAILDLLSSPVNILFPTPFTVVLYLGNSFLHQPATQKSSQ